MTEKRYITRIGAIFLSIVLVAVLLGYTGASALGNTILIPADLNTPGDQLLTIDTATGFVWLDLTITDGMSYNQVVSQLGPGGTLEGFRYATLAEVIELWEHAGIDTTGLPSSTPIVENFAPISAFQALVGLTNIGLNTSDSIGLVADTDVYGSHPIPFARIFTNGPYTGTGAVYSSSSRGPDQFGDNFGSWLIMDTGPTTIEVTIDVKPGSYPNSINLRSRGVVPAAVLTTDDFDASNLDPDTVVFADASPLRWAIEDVDFDGDMDFLFHFKVRELNLDESSTEAVLIGETFDHISLQGKDDVQIVPIIKVNW